MYIASVHITDEVLGPAQRIGVNIGAHNDYEACALRKNLIGNPSRGPQHNALIIPVAPGATTTQIQYPFYDANWGKGYADDFWTSAEYVVLTGNMTETRGKVLGFNRAIPDTNGTPRPTWTIDPLPSAPSAYTLIAVHGYQQQTADMFFLEPTDSGTPLEKKWTPSFVRYLDTLGRDYPPAGKQLPVSGPWVFRFDSEIAGLLRVKFYRQSGAVLLDKIVTVQSGPNTIPFDVPVDLDTDDTPGALVFQLFVDAPLVINHLYLGAEHTNPTVFTDWAVDALQRLQPGCLRYWAGQTAYTPEQLFAGDHIRGTASWSPVNPNAAPWSYSVPQFIELCETVNAEPWIVLPPWWGDREVQRFAAEWKALGYSGPVYWELGNEMWGSAAPGTDPFAGMSAYGPLRLRELSEHWISNMRTAGVDGELIVGSQAGAVGTTQVLDQGNADALAIAPYWGSLTQSDAAIEALLATPAYWMEAGYIAQHRAATDKPLAVYEYNNHCTGSPLDYDALTAYVDAPEQGTALAVHGLRYLQAGVAPVCAFQFAQYAVADKEGRKIRLWGLLENIARGETRPTFDAVAAVNAVAQGVVLRVDVDCATRRQDICNDIREAIDVPVVEAFAWRHDDGRIGIAMANMSGEPVEVTVDGNPFVVDAGELVTDYITPVTNAEPELVDVTIGGVVVGQVDLDALRDVLWTE